MEGTPLIFLFAAGFALFAFVAMTAFLKLSVVFMVVRQALGMQSVPSNMIIMALAVFISIYIAKPVISQSVFAMTNFNTDFSSADSILDMLQTGLTPFQEFISFNTNREYLLLFTEGSQNLWSGSGAVASEDDILIQIPAFMLTELTEAFEIGFVLYLPFVAIDLAVTGILMALGMQMVQPNIIAVPFKLLTFVFVDGWSRLVEGLMMTYSA